MNARSRKLKNPLHIKGALRKCQNAMSEPIHIISLGAGVQSSTIALMCAKGELPMPKIAVFADTQCEPQNVYAWVEYLKEQLPFPVIITSKGNLEKESCRIRLSKRSGKRYMWALIPAFLKHPDGHITMMGRKCTLTFKVDLVRREIRKQFNVIRGKSEFQIQQAIGISTDEAHRMKDSVISYITNRYPLIDLGMSRTHCLQWLENNGFPEPPKSACRGCPFHSDAQWLWLKINEPEEFAGAVQWERDLQEAQRNQEALLGVPYLHRSCVPLEQIDFTPSAIGYHQLTMFGNECEGMCGV